MEHTIMQSAFFCLIIILLRNGNLSTAEVLSNPGDDKISPLKSFLYDKSEEVNKGAITRIKRQFGYPYDPYTIRRPIPIIIGGGGIGFGVFGQRGFGGRGYGGWGFGGRGFGGRGFGGRGFGGRGFGGRGFGGRGFGGRGFGGFGGRGGRG